MPFIRFKSTHSLSVVCFAILFFCTVPVVADVLTMSDGSVLMGQVLSQEKNTLKFKTAYAGTIKIKWDQVKHLKTDTPIKVMLADEKLIAATSIHNTAGMSELKEYHNQLASVKTDTIAYINPEPWRLNKGYKMSGRANLSLKSQYGNTEKDEFDLDARLELRSIQDRYIFNANLENDNSKGNTTADNWLFSGKYDYFVSKKRYYGFGLSFERDKFTDLNLRTTLNPYVGHQFYESKALNLKAEVGLAKVYDDYIQADDSDYMALNWHVSYDQYLFNELTQFYHKHEGSYGLEKSDKLTFDSWTGLRFPLQFGIVASTEIQWEYDSQPQSSLHKSDTTYRLKIGYQW